VPRLEASEFPRKHSVQFITENGKASRPFYFSEYYPLPMAVTWQVERAEFDRMLLERARESGAEVREGWSVRDVVFEGERAVGVRASPVEPEEATVENISARVVVDASGQTALIARKLGLIVPDPKLAKAAVFAHYEGAIRDSGIDEGAILVVHTKGNKGWFWFIPLSRGRVSVGVVGDSKELLKKRGTPEGVLAAEIEESPEMKKRLADARKVSPVRVLRDFSYRSRRCAGDGWVLVGDAFGFLDPVYSSGVLLATKSGQMAAEAVDAGLQANDLSGERLGRHGAQLSKGMESIRKLVYAFYTPGFSFAQFIREHPEHRKKLTDILVGDVFKEGVDDIFGDMARYCDIPQPRSLEAPAAGAGETGKQGRT
jgi:flavin-dependent dehydrogenase